MGVSAMPSGMAGHPVRSLGLLSCGALFGPLRHRVRRREPPAAWRGWGRTTARLNRNDAIKVWMLAIARDAART